MMAVARRRGQTALLILRNSGVAFAPMMSTVTASES